MTLAAPPRSANELLVEIVTWFGRDSLVGPEYTRAAAEFFGGGPPWYAPDDSERRQTFGRCAEWFAYHRPAEVLGRTPFEHLVASLALSGRLADREAMIRFRGQVFDFFEVVKATERELVLRASLGGREHHVENPPVAAGWLRKGRTILTRIFPWQDTYVLSCVMTQFSARDRWVARFRCGHEGLDPQEVEAELFIRRRHPARIFLPRDQVEAELDDFFDAFGIRQSVAESFGAIARCASPVEYLRGLLGRLARKPQVSQYDLNDLGTLLVAAWHHCGRPEFGGTTPAELAASDPGRYQAEVLPRLSWGRR